MAQVNENVIFRNKIGILTIFGEGASLFIFCFSGVVLPLSLNASHVPSVIFA